ncbi:hypothetical protein DH2020_009286 [Rehmannia glutinosa]|uniref:Calmodulin-binding domain-containing protein n=1 Tax=Rehmannia glutinosa TaxID=99300 RepID=A0ABR0X5V5_REHGL
MSRAEKKTSSLSKQHSSPVKSKPVKIKPSFSSDNSDVIRSSPVKSKPVKVKPSSSSDKSDGLRGKGRRTNSESETGRNMTASKASTKKVLALAPSAATFPPKLSVIKTAYNNNSRKGGNWKLVSHPKDRNRMRRAKTKASNNEEVSEKILHVIKTENEKNVFESTPNEPSSPKSPSHEKSSSFSSHKEENEETEYSNGEGDEFISNKNESLEISKAPPVKQNHNKTPRKTKVVVTEDKKCSPAVKLKFRNGKVVDLQSNNNSPRRLRFRKARVLGAEEGKGDLRRRIFKKAAFNGNATGSEVSSEKVVLKHQDVQDKKDAQGLFNNVIEETASKLVESRKSKVKALVGAFETVISLQESKPSLQAVG